MVKKRVCSFVIAMIAPVLCQVFPAFANEATDFGHIITFQTGSVGGPSSPGSVTNPRLIPGDDTVTVNLVYHLSTRAPPRGLCYTRPDAALRRADMRLIRKTTAPNLTNRCF